MCVEARARGPATDNGLVAHASSGEERDHNQVGGPGSPSLGLFRSLDVIQAQLLEGSNLVK